MPALRGTLGASTTRVLKNNHTGGCPEKFIVVFHLKLGPQAGISTIR